MTDNILLMLHRADPERPGSIMTIHLMDILVQFLPEYDQCTSICHNDEQIKVHLAVGFAVWITKITDWGIYEMFNTNKEDECVNPWIFLESNDATDFKHTNLLRTK